MAGPPGKDSFGGPPKITSSGAPSSFGSSNLFGGAGLGNAFGGTTFGAGANTSAGGATGAPATSNGPGLFGATSAFGLGNRTTPAKPESGTVSGGGNPTMPRFNFGNPNPASSTGGAPGPPTLNKSSTTPAGAPPIDLFSNSTRPSNPFGSKDQANTQTQASGPQQTASGSGLFGAIKPASSAAAPASFPSLGATKPAGPSTPFAGFGQNSLAAAASTQPTASQPASSLPSLGDMIKNSTTTAPPGGAPGGLFGFPAPTATSGPSATPSGASAAPSLPPTLGGFGMNASKSPAPPSSSQPATNPFGGLGQSVPTTSSAPNASSAAPTGGLFMAAPATTLSAPTTTATTSRPASNAPPAPASTSVAPADPKASTSGGFPKPSFFNPASSKGPQPLPQSRLKNKTMDEILTRWASDLTKYTKEFQAHAETIADWDQILVENMAKITKLYAATVTSEKQTASIEMQLSVVENQQSELESWLDKYESHVDEMLRKQDVDARQDESVIDLEREKTYKTAEKLGERLDEMGRDLGTMIEEINAANTALSGASKDGEPITHIVRILNSHLSHLQAIDQGTVALQAKVNAAMSSAQPNTIDGAANGGAAVEDFYRSYLGRR